MPLSVLTPSLLSLGASLIDMKRGTRGCTERNEKTLPDDFEADQWLALASFPL
jgi:hypothetical protein